MTDVFKSSGAAMGAGRDALDTASRGLEDARIALEGAYRRLQGQWQSSEARGRADAEFAGVNDWLRSSVEWTKAVSTTTADADAMFARVERAGLT